MLCPDNWSLLSPTEKREWRFEGWRASAGCIPFVSPEARRRYGARIERLMAVYKIEEPDQVPVHVEAAMLPLAASGLSYHTCMYHPEKAVDAWRAFADQYSEQIDSCPTLPFFTAPGTAFDSLGQKLWAYPGHGLGEEGVGLQFLEGEYMLADEYDALIRDPSDFWLRVFLPRAYGVFEPFERLSPLTDITMMPAMQLPALAQPGVLDSLQRLMDAGQAMARYFQVVGPAMAEGARRGYFTEPPGLFASAPFDTIGDCLRGTRGILSDMYRQPAKLLEALEVIADVTIRSLLDSPRAAEAVAVFFPLHKGGDGWMSQEQFLSFYWPTLKRVLDALIAEGLTPILFAEGCYDSRLDLVDEFPQGAVHWWFDRTDMAQAKRKLGGSCSLQGNVSSSLLAIGTPEQVTDACESLVDICAPGGGYVLGAGAFPDFPRIENLQAMVDVGQKTGRA